MLYYYSSYYRNCTSTVALLKYVSRYRYVRYLPTYIYSHATLVAARTSTGSETYTLGRARQDANDSSRGFFIIA